MWGASTIMAAALLCLIGFSVESYKFSMSREKLQQATYISVLAALQNRALKIEESEKLVEQVLGLFAGVQPDDASVVAENDDIKVSARLEIKTVFAWVFAIDSFKAEAISRGSMGLGDVFIDNELRHALKKLDIDKKYPELSALLADFAKRNAEAEKKQQLEEEKAAIEVTRLPAGNTFVPRGETANRQSVDNRGFSISGQNSGGPVGLSQAAGRFSILPPKGMEREFKMSRDGNGKVVFDENVAGNASVLVPGSREKIRRKRHRAVKNSLRFSFDRRNNYQPDHRSGVNIVEMLSKPGSFQKAGKKSAFAWADFWRYVKVSYDAGRNQTAIPSRRPGKDPDKSAKNKKTDGRLQDLVIQALFFGIIFANIALWVFIAIVFWRRFKKRRVVKDVVDNSRLDRVLGH